MNNTGTITGRLPADLANAISDAIHAALNRGMQIDEAVCVTITVAADYARGEYGNAYLRDLAELIEARASQPMPRDVSQ